jgi:alcohol dehydrogenase (cytochrome c)
MTLRRACELLMLLALLPSAGCGVDEETETAEPAEQTRRAPLPALFPQVTDQALAAATTASQDWLVYGGAYNNQRYSSLDQVTRANVSDLTLAWIYQTGISESFETTPLVAGNTMYLTTPESHVIALNAATGDKLWEFIPRIAPDLTVCCGPVNRGVAAWGDKVYVGTPDSRLIALNNRNGQPVWQKVVTDSGRTGYSISMAPLAYDGKVVVGVAGSEFGIRGFVAAYDAQTGQQVWKWYTIPSPESGGWLGQWKQSDPFGTPLHRDVAREQLDSETYPSAWMRGGGGVAMTPAYDPTTRTLFVSVGSPAPMLQGDWRPGDNLYTGSVVALDATSGALKWYFQIVPHDMWDMSPASPPVLYTLGESSYVAHAGKTGWLYVMDMPTGRPVLRSDNYAPQENLFTPPTGEGIRMAPGANGGAGWSPASFSPRTGLMYTLASHQPMAFIRGDQERVPYQLWLGGAFRYLPGEEQYGLVSAIDVRTGTIKWQRRVPKPLLGGSTVTAGDVLFVGQGSGTFDAFDARTGNLLWQYRVGAGVHGGPVTYMVGDVQYVAVAAGGNFQLDTPRGDDVLVFALRDRVGASAMSGYGSAKYRRSGPTLPGAARQVPAEAPAPKQ